MTPSAETVLRTERLTLRPARMDDLPAVHAIMRRPEAMSYWSTPPHSTMAQTEEWLTDQVSRLGAADSADFMVELDGALIGKCGFWRLPEIGYIFHPDVWGHGYASEALVAVLDYGFGTLGLEQVKADVDPRNEASIRLLLRHGFIETGRANATWQIGDVWVDSVYFGLTREDWARRMG